MNGQKVVGKVGKFNICFRPEQLTSHAGTVLLHDFVQRLGMEKLLDEELHVKTRDRGYRESEAIKGLVYNMILGGEHLSDLEVLRGDPGTQELLNAEGILAPTTAGEFLRKFDMGDVYDLQRVHLRLQERVRPHQQTSPCTIDLDSSISEQVSTHKEGSTKAYNTRLGGFHAKQIRTGRESGGHQRLRDLFTRISARKETFREREERVEHFTGDRAAALPKGDFSFGKRELF